MLEQKYSNLVTATEKVVKQQSPELTEFRNRVTCLPSWMEGEHYQQYITENVSRISNFATIEEFFVFLNGCWNYLNYHLLQHIVNIYGDDKTQQMVEQYISEVESFRKETSLQQFWKAIPIRHFDVPSSLCEVIFKHSNLTSTSTLEDVEKFRQEFAHHYSLSKFTLILRRVQPGSVATVWLMPLPLVLFLRDQVAHVGAEFYQQMHVFEMTVDGSTVYDASG